MGAGCHRACAARKDQAGGQTRTLYSPLDRPEVGAPAEGKAKKARCCCGSWACWGTCVAALVIAVALAAVPFWHFCLQPPPPTSQALELVQSRLGGKETYTWVNLPEQQDNKTLAWCAGQLKNATEVGAFQYGFASAELAARLMYKCSKVPGLFERTPSKLRGVFWARGSAAGQELVVLQHGRWFEDEGLFVAPYAPYTWAWPRQEPTGKRLRQGPGAAWQAAFAATALSPTMSLRFEDCPGAWSLPLPWASRGQRCARGSAGADLTYASLQFHPKGDLTALEDDEVHTLEDASGSADAGGRWHRASFGGPPGFERAAGQCKVLAETSYDLVQVLDEAGHPLEPAFSRFLAHMVDVPLFLWAGYANGTRLSALSSGDLADVADVASAEQVRRQVAEAAAASDGRLRSPYI